MSISQERRAELREGVFSFLMSWLNEARDSFHLHEYLHDSMEFDLTEEEFDFAYSQLEFDIKEMKEDLCG